MRFLPFFTPYAKHTALFLKWEGAVFCRFLYQFSHIEADLSSLNWHTDDCQLSDIKNAPNFISLMDEVRSVFHFQGMTGNCA